MFERYTEKARRAIFFARYEASRYGSPFITNEHILLGLLREEKKIFETLFSDWEKSARLEEQVRAQQEKNASKEQIPASVDLPLDNPAKRVLAYAAEEAERLNDRHIGTEHLLLGLLREPSPAFEILAANGIDLRNTREKLHAEPRRNHYTIPYTVRELQTAADLQVEFVDAETKRLIEVVTSQIALPAIGDEIVFESAEGTRSFRVVDVSYIFSEPPSASSTRQLSKIRVSLKITSEST